MPDLLLSSVDVSRLNPLHFVQKGFTPLPQYRSKHLDDYHYPDTSFDWMASPEWIQPFQQNDRLQLQVFSEIGPVAAILLNETGDEVYQSNFAQKQRSFFLPTWFIYELDWDLSIFPEGIYRLQLKFGSGASALYLISNLFFIQEVIDGSYLVEYWHYREKEGIFFETGFKTQVRTFGSLVYDEPGSKNIVYEDQVLDPVLVSSKSFDTWRFYIGDSAGTPDFQLPMWRMIFGCQNVKIDSRLYTRNTDQTQLEKKEEDGYALKGWSIVLRDRYNRGSRKFTVDPQAELVTGLNAVITVETKGFVSDDNGGSYYNVPDIE